MPLVGRTDAWRMLTVILAPGAIPGAYHPVTARPASKRERLRFVQFRVGAQ